MIADHFAGLTGNLRIESPLIWECTRFCLAPDAGREVAPALVLGAGEVMETFHLSHFIGVFDRRMRRIYNRLGVVPDVIGESGEGAAALGVGLWEISNLSSTTDWIFPADFRTSTGTHARRVRHIG